MQDLVHVHLHQNGIGSQLDALEQIIHIIFVIRWWWKSLLHHQDFHRAKLKLGSDLRHGSPLTDDFGHHSPNVGQ